MPKTFITESFKYVHCALECTICAQCALHLRRNFCQSFKIKAVSSFATCVNHFSHCRYSHPFFTYCIFVYFICVTRKRWNRFAHRVRIAQCRYAELKYVRQRVQFGRPDCDFFFFSIYHIYIRRNFGPIRYPGEYGPQPTILSKTICLKTENVLINPFLVGGNSRSQRFKYYILATD